MTESVDGLRSRLASRESLLNSLRARVKAAKAAPEPKATISDIQRRYLSAVADLETKRAPDPAPSAAAPRGASDGVSALASRWNKGMEGKKVERSTNVTVRGDVSGTKKNFATVDAIARKSSSTASAARAKSRGGDADAPAQVLVEDDDGLPSWAKNQQKKVIRKENARSSIRDVDVRELQGSVLTAADSGAEVKSERVEARGNVKAALAMWGKTAEEDAKELERKKEEEARRAAAQAKMRRDREVEERNRAVQRAVSKFAGLALSDMTDEPDDDVELSAFLERKIKLIDDEIAQLEAELERASA